MRCEHCRGAYQGAVDMSVPDFERVIQFCCPHIAQKGGYLITGGEPLLHPQFRELLLVVKEHVRGDEFLTVATNGSFLTEELLDFLEGLAFPDTRISISLDSCDSSRHNAFRHSSHAFESAVQAIGLVVQRPNIQSIVRATIQKDQLQELPSMVEFVESLGADILSVSSIIPAGRALKRPDLWLDVASKKQLVVLVAELNCRRNGLVVDLNDPLAYISAEYSGSSGEYGGCIAGIGTFSIEPDGTMLPCPLLHNQPIMNIKGISTEQILDEYINSRFVHDLLERKLTGACGSCELRFTCGGCRARSEAVSGSFLGADPDCWLC
ncbi:MAG: hypothetical protein COW93_02305 [Parcubacteria group bacterium CG22_combo_CG10-13_8_21_14_all_41_9]|nr:MAG: hypothetical protein COW93_02305 [Parcubacteria group bacterium CG22_combo_CG10-13_8_21_14_all_41_9]